MDSVKIESVSPELAPLVTKPAQPAPEAAPKKEPPPAAPPEDKVDVQSLRETSSEIRDPNPRAGMIYDYTVNSSHDLVIKVKELDTRREVKQIPDKAYQAAKRGYHKVVDKIIDEEA